MSYSVFVEKHIPKSIVTYKNTSNWDFLISYDYKYIGQCKRWCKEKVGANNWNYFGEFRKVPFEFRFRRAEDALAFRISFGIWN